MRKPSCHNATSCTSAVFCDNSYGKRSEKKAKDEDLHCCSPFENASSVFLPQVSVSLPSNSYVKSCAFVPSNGRLCVSATRDGCLSLHDVLRGTPLLIYSYPRSSDDIYGANNWRVGECFYSSSSLPSVGSESVDSHEICDLSFFAEENECCFIVGYESGDINIYDYRFCEKGRPALRFCRAHKGGVCTVRGGYGGSVYAVISGGKDDGWIRFFDIRYPSHNYNSNLEEKTAARQYAQPFFAYSTSKNALDGNKPKKGIVCMDVCMDGRLLSVCTLEGELSVYKLPDMRLLKNFFLGYDSVFHSCCFTANGKYVLLSAEGEIPEEKESNELFGKTKDEMKEVKESKKNKIYSSLLWNVINSNEIISLKMPPDSSAIYDNYFLIKEKEEFGEEEEFASGPKQKKNGQDKKKQDFSEDDDDDEIEEKTGQDGIEKEKGKKEREKQKKEESNEIKNRNENKKLFEISKNPYASFLVYSSTSFYLKSLTRKFWEVLSSASSSFFSSPSSPGSSSPVLPTSSPPFPISHSQSCLSIDSTKSTENTKPHYHDPSKIKINKNHTSSASTYISSNRTYKNFPSQISDFYARIGERAAAFSRYDLYNMQFICTPWKGNNVAGVGGSSVYTGIHLWDAHTGVCLNTSNLNWTNYSTVKCISAHYDVHTPLLLTGGSCEESWHSNKKNSYNGYYPCSAEKSNVRKESAFARKLANLTIWMLSSLNDIDHEYLT